ncbi:MAG: hypothetical protein BMS9Abin13_322 [Patescibacteria group bacterium]|nr:MAG: hypothetical protein BMS9Abin13_322 [Patescibacteria group bacterium]
MVFVCDDIPKNKGLVVYQDSVGFFYLKKLVQKEGLATPFSSIEEIELYLGIKKLTLLKGVDLTGRKGSR